MIAKPKTVPTKKIVKPAQPVRSGKEKQPAKPMAKERFYEAKGGRKTAVARVRAHLNKTGIVVNDKQYKEYFHLPIHQEAVEAPLKLLNKKDIGITVKVYGGGSTGQAEAVRHGIASVLVKLNPESRKILRAAGFLTRDSRMVERKKYGLKKARRAPQWAKR